MCEVSHRLIIATSLLFIKHLANFLKIELSKKHFFLYVLSIEILEGCILSDTKDTWTWSLEGSGESSVSSIRKTIDAAFFPCGNVKTRWVKEVPVKINILAWKVSNDYLPTRFNLSRRDHVQDFEVVGFGISGD
ncbi:hypothetical protein Tco_0581920 [Tanacetum coccineum]